MSRLLRALPAALALAAAAPVGAADLLIRDATVHTVDAAGTLADTDVLVRDGRIAAVGRDLAAPAGATVVEARGRPLTPGLFGGVTTLGLEDISLEATTVDAAYAPTAQQPPGEAEYRPEFDVTVAYNPEARAIAITRVEGVSFAVVAPGTGSSFVRGLGAVAILDGRTEAFVDASRTLFLDLGADATALSGNSRAAQWMLLAQMAREARPAAGSDESDVALLTPEGRAVLGRYLAGGRVAFDVDRASDIRQVLAFARRHGLRPVIVGGVEAWRVADALAAAKVPVLVDALQNLPADFDSLYAGYENAKRLDAAGVRIAIFQAGDATMNARKNRQVAGNAVAHGLPWERALAALTANPADIFGVADRGRIAVGRAADLVLWSGDPLEVTTVAEQVWIEGRAVDPRTRQTRLRDRYLPEQPALPRPYLGR